MANAEDKEREMRFSDLTKIKLIDHRAAIGRRAAMLTKFS
jgi:hypothetical protein